MNNKTCYTVSFTYTVTVETDGDDSDAQDLAYEDFASQLRSGLEAHHFFIGDAEESDDSSGLLGL